MWCVLARRAPARVGIAAVGLLAAGASAESPLPIDCLPDSLVRWEAAAPDPEARFGATSLPGIVLGPPGDSAAVNGSTSVASLGNGGTAVLEWRATVIEDGPGPDFIVFENAFYVGAAPASPADDYQVFAEPGIVEVSADGATWVRFPFDEQALADAAGVNIDRALQERLRGLSGITPTFTGNWTVPDDPTSWDASGQGGVSGAGGDAFDLATVGLTEARFVRIIDAGSANGPAGAGEGFDLDAVVVLHGRPAAPATPDRDGDGVPDLAEQELHGTDPDLADSDGDGVDDGRELAGCRDPNLFDDAPWLEREPRLWLRDDGGCTELRWTFLGSGASYDVARGELSALASSPGGVDLGLTSCLADDEPAVRWTCDAEIPAPGAGWFYVVRVSGAPHYGRSSLLELRETPTGCP